MISDRVLAANPAGNVAPDSLEIIERTWKVRTPSAQFGYLPENARISVTIGIVIDADSVDRCTRPLCNLKHIVQTAVARIVPAIAQDNERLPVSPAVFQMLNSYGQGVV